MKAVPPSSFRGARGFALAVLVVGFSPGLTAAPEGFLVEVQGQFVHVTKSQMADAFGAAEGDRSTRVLTPGQFEAVRVALKKAGAEVFSEPRAISQSGRSAQVEEGKEFRYPTKYEPSKKEPGKVVPIGFETRLVGITLQVNPLVDNQGNIRLEANSTFTRFLGFVDYGNVGPSGKDTPALEDLLRAPLRAGNAWQPVFAAFTGIHVFDLKDGETALMSGPVAVESRDHSPGRPILRSNAPVPVVLVFLTAKKVVRD